MKMKKLNLNNGETMKTLILSLMLLTMTLETQAKSEKWILDTAHSKVGFEISHLVIATVEGKFTAFTGDIHFDSNDKKSAMTSLKINTSIDAATIDTGNEKRDQHLKSADFFDVKKFPKITFVSTRVASKDNRNFKIEGELTMAGVTKKVTLDTKYLGTVEAYDVKRIAFKATTTIKREDFGLKWNDVVEAGPVVGSEVMIELKIQAKRAADL